MKRSVTRCPGRLAAIALALALLFLPAQAATAGDYAALDGVKGLDTVFDVTLGDPVMATIVFPAVREVYQDQNVRALPAPPRTVIVFHGEAVKLISSDRSGFDETGREALDKVADMIRQFKKDGVRMEVCMYAVKALGVAPKTLMPEIDRVGNGFIAVAGYQARGFSLVSVH